MNKFQWEKGYTVVFAGRCQRVSVVEKIERNVLTLHDARERRTAQDAILRHRDDTAIQAAIDRALKENRNVYLPVGHYCLSRGLRCQPCYDDKGKLVNLMPPQRYAGGTGRQCRVCKNVFFEVNEPQPRMQMRIKPYTG